MPAPQPRTSSLTKRHPAAPAQTAAHTEEGPTVTPREEPTVSTPSPGAIPAQDSGVQAPPAQAPAAEASAESEAPDRSRGGRPRTRTVNGEVKRKTNFYITPSDKARAMRAQRIGSVYGEDMDTWTGFVERAVMELTKEIERKYNDSKPF